jgi:hypothetical protein
LPAAEVVHFILEGKIKADPCLSAILDSNRSATALNVPSVGQWEAFELETFAELLRGKRVVVVVDSDADGNDNVMTQGFFSERGSNGTIVSAYALRPPRRTTASGSMRRTASTRSGSTITSARSGGPSMSLR